MSHRLIGLSLVYALSWVIFGPFSTPPFAAIIAVPLIWLSGHDLATHIIPDGATISVAVLGLTFASLTGQSLLTNAGSALLICLLFWLFGDLYYRLRGSEGFGIGDAKLLGAMTCGVGPGQIWLVILLAAVGGIVAAGMQRRKSVAEIA